MAELFGDITFLKGVGGARAEKYAKMGIKQPYELLMHIPRDYFDFTSCVKIADARPDERNFLRLKVLEKHAPFVTSTSLVIYKVVVTDGEDIATVVFFNAVYSYRMLIVGKEYYFVGKVTPSVNGPEIKSPVFVNVNENAIQPVYRLTKGITVETMRNNVRQALTLLPQQNIESLTEQVREKYELAPLAWSLQNIHFPESMSAQREAQKRLAFDELLDLCIGMSLMRSNTVRENAFAMDGEISVNKFVETLPFRLTDDQSSAVRDIISDLCKNVPMNRLLQGDVGSGKTAVAVVACCFTALNHRQSALMAPTEILAIQHYKTFSELLEPFGVKVCLLTGSMTAKKKSNIRELIASGEADVIVGTHAIIQKDVKYKSLSLVITDEQHRFGVQQRTELAEKGNSPHRLVMSATPIPRTLALIIYGDLDISVIKQMPAGRKPIKTYAVTGRLRQRAFGFVRKLLDEGRQAYIVCPKIEDGENELFSVKSYGKEIAQRELRGYSVALLHGKMSSAEKEDTMKQFRDGEIQVLICTTVVEVGVDVPNAAVMVIENAERFGLSQLHQLRGRIGRGQYESHCILITDNTTEECIRRMKVISANSDGFVISEEDLKLRGPGDFFGNAQHGLPPLSATARGCSTELMNSAKECAAEILSADSDLEMPENGILRQNAIRMFDKFITG